ncbi:hypothetical protein BH23ACT7_BH23ACT7_16300 [soil metagenome]|jgi:Flp pilus assembly pilin Flp
MSELILTVYIWTGQRLDRALDRGPAGERGQTMAEYLGAILVIAALIAVLVASDIGDRLRAHITAAIDRVFTGGGG